MKKIALIVTIALFGASAANAFIHDHENALLWTGDVDENWSVKGNWDNVKGPAFDIPGGNNAFACIDSGAANVTEDSAPGGRVNRIYIGGTDGATLNVSANSKWGRAYIGWDDGETGTVNLTAGTMVMNDKRFYLGYKGNSKFTMSGGALKASKISLAEEGTSASSMEISGGSLDASSYLWMKAGAATLTVNGSKSTITMDRFLVDSGKGHTLKLGLDAGGVTTIYVDGEISDGSSYEGATLNDLTIEIEALPGFTGGAGSTYDVISSETHISAEDITVESLIDEIDGFDVDVVYEGGKRILRLTGY